MSTFLPVDEGNDEFYIEVISIENTSGIRKTAKTEAIEKLTLDRFSTALKQAILPACNTFVSLWENLQQSPNLTAEGAEVEFNLGLTTSGNVAIVQASGQASFKVKINWKFNSSNTLEVQDKFISLSSEVNEDIDSLQKEAQALEELMNKEEISNRGENFKEKLSNVIAKISQLEKY